jgi:hypothetical protein
MNGRFFDKPPKVTFATRAGTWILPRSLPCGLMQCTPSAALHQRLRVLVDPETVGVARLDLVEHAAARERDAVGGDIEDANVLARIGFRLIRRGAARRARRAGHDADLACRRVEPIEGRRLLDLLPPAGNRHASRLAPAHGPVSRQVLEQEAVGVAPAPRSSESRRRVPQAPRCRARSARSATRR